MPDSAALNLDAVKKPIEATIKEHQGSQRSNTKVGGPKGPPT